jgi:hypothetical protein
MADLSMETLMAGHRQRVRGLIERAFTDPKLKWDCDAVPDFVHELVSAISGFSDAVRAWHQSEVAAQLTASCRVFVWFYSMRSGA